MWGFTPRPTREIISLDPYTQKLRFCKEKKTEKSVFLLFIRLFLSVVHNLQVIG